ncbi:MAG: DMT family transporter [Clostridia bacterium]|nr:DMT family transporter [Clostridia bacterium]
MKAKFLGPLMLLLTALLWGIAFVAQSVGTEQAGPLTFNGVRTIIGAVCVLPVALFFRRKNEKKLTVPKTEEEKKEDNRILLKAGVLCGLVLFCATNLQNLAFEYTDAGKIAFITSLYMLFVPVFGLVFLRKKVRAILWPCCAVGLLGMFLLCMGEAAHGINKGDVLTLACSVVFAVHILVVDRYVDRVDPVMMSCIQFFVAGTLTVICAFILEEPSIAGIRACIGAILYAGICSSAIAYTLQIVGQKYTEATVATILLSMESVFGAISSAIILHETMTVREVIGCALMFVAIIVSQLPEKKKAVQTV